MDDACKTVLTIPQFTGTCWFNSLLMVLLYSDGMRKYLTNNLIKSELYFKNKELYKILLDILKNRHRKINKNDSIYFNELKPENILKFLHTSDKTQFYFDPDKYTGHFGEYYFVRLFEYFGLKKKVLFLARDLSDTSKYVYSPLNNKQIVREKSEKYEVNFEIKLLKESEKQKIMSKPNIDILVVTQNSYYSFRQNTLFQTKSKDLEETIEFNGMIYKLDSVLIRNFNFKTCSKSHQIAGVTCDDKRYIYNGWIRQTQDPAKSKTIANYLNNVAACELMNYDWLNNKEDFCLLSSKCGIENRKTEKELCFNTSKTNEATYIYVKVEGKENLLKASNNKLKQVTTKCNSEIKKLKNQIDESTSDNAKRNLEKVLKSKEDYCKEYIAELKIRIEDIVNPIKSATKQEPKCSKNRIYNPSTNNCVKRNTALGKKLIKLEKTMEDIFGLIEKESPHSGKCKDLSMKKIHEKIDSHNLSKVLADNFKLLKDKNDVCDILRSIKDIYNTQLMLIHNENDIDNKLLLVENTIPVMEEMFTRLIEDVKKQKATVKKEVKKCKENEILNPKTNRCVSKTGTIGKKLLQNTEDKITTTGVTKKCKENEILNPKTNRCVSRTGTIGRKLIK